MNEAEHEMDGMVVMEGGNEMEMQEWGNEMMAEEEEGPAFRKPRYDKAVIGQFIIGTIFAVIFGTLFIVVRKTITPLRLEGEKCGIPIIWWNETWLTILGCLGFDGLLVIIVGLVTANAVVTGVVWFVPSFLIVITWIGWTIYGFGMIFNPLNDCGVNPETTGWQTMMIILLCIGSIPLFCIGCCIVKCIRRKARRRHQVEEEPMFEADEMMPADAMM